MKIFNINIPVVALSYDELNELEHQLVNAAREYTYNSYSPYSHFSVGAAIRLDNGEVVCGANQENAAFPSSLCAERTACYSAGARYPNAKFEAIAIAARGTDGGFVTEPVAPCGACRQALLEYELKAGHDVEVLLVGNDVVYRISSVRTLLPLTFTGF